MFYSPPLRFLLLLPYWPDISGLPALLSTLGWLKEEKETESPPVSFFSLGSLVGSLEDPPCGIRKCRKRVLEFPSLPSILSSLSPDDINDLNLGQRLILSHTCSLQLLLASAFLSTICFFRCFFKVRKWQTRSHCHVSIVSYIYLQLQTF